METFSENMFEFRETKVLCGDKGAGAGVGLGDLVT